MIEAHRQLHADILMRACWEDPQKDALWSHVLMNIKNLKVLARWCHARKNVGRIDSSQRRRGDEREPVLQSTTSSRRLCNNPGFEERASNA